MIFRLTASILVIILIITLGIINVISVRSICKEIIDETCAAATDGSIDKLIRIRAAWSKKINVLSILVPHDHVDSVSESMDRMIAYLQNNDHKEFAAETETCLNRIRIIKNYDMPTLRAIF